MGIIGNKIDIRPPGETPAVSVSGKKCREERYADTFWHQNEGEKIVHGGRAALQPLRQCDKLGSDKGDELVYAVFCPGDSDEQPLL